MLVGVQHPPFLRRRQDGFLRGKLRIKVADIFLVRLKKYDNRNNTTSTFANRKRIPNFHRENIRF